MEDLAHERGVDICHETVRLWVSRFGPMFACETTPPSTPPFNQERHLVSRQTYKDRRSAALAERRAIAS